MFAVKVRPFRKKHTPFNRQWFLAFKHSYNFIVCRIETLFCNVPLGSCFCNKDSETNYK